MSERIFIGVAWPYANGPLHLGHIAGAYLPADIFARYHRAKGNEVLMVSGSDQHGTPITIRAEQEGTTPAEVAERYHQEFLESWKRLGIEFDLFTKTETKNHAETTHDIFLNLLNKDYIFKGGMLLPFCPFHKRFLPDRYVEGTCPYCAFPQARGDQCDNCGRPLNPSDLINPVHPACGTTPEFIESEHFFLRLTAFEEQLKAWVEKQIHWRPNVLNFTSRFLADGLKDRAITRDIEWGISVPVPGYEDKRIYVWFEAVIGYLSASKEWSKNIGDPEKWRDFWQKPTKMYYFIGKDNIPFHTIIWPAMLIGYGGLNLPYDVPANEFLTLEGRQLSTSRNWAVWVPDYLERYDPDPLRYLLSANMPETGDADFSWREFWRRNNDELVATYGNLAHRVLTFIQRNFEGRVPEAEPLDEASEELLKKVEATFDTVDELLGGVHFRESVRAIMALAQEANRYLDDKAPWKMIKQDRAASGTSLNVVLRVIAGLKTLFYPFLPFSSEKLHRMLVLPGTAKEQGWKWVIPEAGQKLPPPEALFTKLDEDIITEETQRMGVSVAG